MSLVCTANFNPFPAFVALEARTSCFLGRVVRADDHARGHDCSAVQQAAPEGEDASGADDGEEGLQGHVVLKALHGQTLRTTHQISNSLDRYAERSPSRRVTKQMYKYTVTLTPHPFTLNKITNLNSQHTHTQIQLIFI